MRVFPGEAGKIDFAQIQFCAFGVIPLINHQNRLRRADFGASFPQGKLCAPWAQKIHKLKENNYV